MELNELLGRLNSGMTIAGGDEGNIMSKTARNAQRITAQINTGYHEPEELRALFSQLTGREVPESFRLFPPFYADFGKNIHIGQNVFINSCCCFQDQGGIYLGDNALIGHNVVIATLNHPLDPAHRHELVPAPVRLESNVWIGSNATILAGVTIGNGAVVAAGAVVTKDVPPMTVAAGVPAKVVKQIEADA